MLDMLKTVLLATSCVTLQLALASCSDLNEESFCKSEYEKLKAFKIHSNIKHKNISSGIIIVMNGLACEACENLTYLKVKKHLFTSHNVYLFANSERAFIPDAHKNKNIVIDSDIGRLDFKFQGVGIFLVKDSQVDSLIQVTPQNRNDLNQIDFDSYVR
jgi:hypothetical protein